MARIPVSDLPETHVSGIADNTLSSAATGAATGAGIGVCLGLAPANVLGVALTAGALLCASNSSK